MQRSPGDAESFEQLFRAQGYEDFRWIDPQRIVVAQWVRMKCAFGCGEYGTCAACPPNTPPVPECERFFREYARAVVFRFAKTVARPEDRRAWSREVNRKLLDLERAVFLAGCPKAFLLFMDSCHLCETCAPTRGECHHPKLARPAPEAMAVDVFSTVRACGYPIEVLTDYGQEMNRYALLMIE
jgi:predicted metal-binding protein